MKELVGVCSSCGKDIYCESGFFQGIILESGELACMECAVQAADDEEEHT